MFLKKIEIKNFRLWKDTSIELEQQSTMIVGKNNCGKTSFMDLMQLLVKNKNPKFDDYPLQNRKALYQKIIDYMAARCSYKDLEDEFLLPIVNLHIDYSLERVYLHLA
jgi:recombinational DNA repair ATPase RecF